MTVSPSPSTRLQLALVTPAGALAAHPVDEVVAPGVLGELGILPGHLPLLSALAPGVLSFRDGKERTFLAIGVGYLQVGAGNRVDVLVEQAEAAGDIDEDAARKEEQILLAEMQGVSTESPEAQVRAGRLAWAQARLAAKRLGGGGSKAD